MLHTDSDAWFSQWQLRVRAAEGWHVAAGRDLLNCGPANQLGRGAHRPPWTRSESGRRSERQVALARTRSDQASLGDELEMLQNYLEIMKIRFGERLRWRIDVTEEARRRWRDRDVAHAAHGDAALIADDERHLAEDLHRRLQKLWLELEIAAVVHDGAAAATALAEIKPEITFLDIRIPGKSGLDVARFARTRLEHATNQSASARTLTILPFTLPPASLATASRALRRSTAM